jgi:hypothetical protein
LKPVSAKAEVAIEYPDKFYIGTFEHSSQFDAHLDETGISLTLYQGGDQSTRKSVRLHIHYGLVADILVDLAKTVSAMPLEDLHRGDLAAAVKALDVALQPPNQPAKAS